MQKYLYNVCYAIVRCFDMICNAILGGDPRETISRRIGRAIERRVRCRFCYLLCYLLNKIDRDHCRKAADAPAPDGSMAVDKDV